MAIEHITIAENGHLLISFSDGTVMDAGNLRGPAGPQGEKGVGVKGDPGEPGLTGPAGTGIGQTIVQNSITLGATVSAPAVMARSVQRLERQVIGDKLKLIYKLGQESTGKNIGSGDYLLSLPNNVTFNTTYHPVYTGAIWAGGVNNMAKYFIPAYGGIIIDAHWTNQIMVVPYDATRFRLALTNNNSQTTYSFWNSGWYATSAASGINLQLHFEIWHSTPPSPPMVG